MDDFSLLERLMILEDLHDEPGLWRRIAALLHRDKERMVELANRFKIANRDREALLRLASDVPARTLNWSLYLDGQEAALDRLLIDAADMNAPASAEHVRRILTFTPVTLPVTGQDALDLGISPGPIVGQLIKRLEAWWVERDFQPSREECLWELSHMIQAGFDA